MNHEEHEEHEKSFKFIRTCDAGAHMTVSCSLETEVDSAQELAFPRAPPFVFFVFFVVHS
jgi:hypothetical protein